MSNNAMLNKTIGYSVESDMCIRIIHNNQCKGIVIAFIYNGYVYVGHSLCNSSDRFSREKA